MTAGLLVAWAHGASGDDVYLDLNGEDPGFGVDSTVSPIIVDPTLSTWNTDATGGAAGVIGPVLDGDMLHFGLEGDGGIRFDWENYGAVTVSGIHTYLTDGSTAWINRMQKRGGGLLKLAFSMDAELWTEQANSFWWDFATTGDFTKTGNTWLVFGDGGPKVDGTLTIAEGYVVVRNVGTVDANSSFVLNGNGLRFMAGLSGTATIGELSGSGVIVRDGGTGGLGALTVSSSGIDMHNDHATDEIKFGWGASATLRSGSFTTLEINKNVDLTEADQVLVDWGNKVLALNGGLEVVLVGGSAPLTDGDVFDLFSDNISGSFRTISLPSLDAGLRWDISNIYTDGTIMVTASDGVAGPVEIDGLPEDPDFDLNPDGLPTDGTDTWKWDGNNDARVTWGSTPAGSLPLEVEPPVGFAVPIVDVADEPLVTLAPHYDPATTLLTAITPAFEGGNFSHANAVDYVDGVLSAWYEITITTVSGPVYVGAGAEANVLGADSATVRSVVAAQWNDILWDVDPFAAGGIVFDDIASITMTVFARTDTATESTGDSTLFFSILKAPIRYAATTVDPNPEQGITITGVDHTGSSVVLNWTTSGLPSGVDVYRSEVLDGGWTQVGSSGITVGTLTDDEVFSAAFYRVLPTGEMP